MTKELNASAIAKGAPSPSAPSDSNAPERRRSFGMAAKTTLGIMIVGIVPLLIFAVIVLSQQNASVRDQAERVMQGNAERFSTQVDDWIDKNVRVLNAAANMDVMSSGDPTQQTMVLKSVGKAYPWMYLLFTVNPAGQAIARSDGLPLTNYSDRRYIMEAISGGKEVSWETVIGKTSGKPALVIAVPIKAQGKIVGAIAAAMTLEDISRVVATWKAGSTGYAYLVDETGKVVAHPQTDFVIKQRRMVDHPMVAAYRNDKAPHSLRFDDNGAEVLGAVHGNRLQWAIVVQQETAELFAPLHRTIWIGVGLLLGTAVLMGIFSILLSRRIVQPIVSMTAAADQMSMGELKTPIVRTSDDELGLLAESLERLRKSMHAAMSRIHGH